MSNSNPFSFDIVEFGRGNNDRIDQNAAGALAKIQEDLRPTTLVQQAAEQNSRPNTTNLVQQAIEQNIGPKTTGLVQQAAEQNSPPATTTLVREAAEQNKDNVIRAVENPSSENFKNFDEQGIHKWFSEDLETNLIANASQALTRGNVMELLATKPKHYFSGTVGALLVPEPKDFWHSQNEKTDLSKFVSQNRIAAKHAPEDLKRTTDALEQRIDQNLADVKKTGKPLDVNQTDRMRQMAENAAMIKLAVAEVKQPTDPKGAKNLVSGAGHSVSDLIKIAESHGANKDNIQQLKKMVEQFEKR